MTPTQAPPRIHRGEYQYSLHSDDGKTTSLFTSSKQCQMTRHEIGACAMTVYGAVVYLSRKQAARILRTWRTPEYQDAIHITRRNSSSYGSADNKFCSVYCTNLVGGKHAVS